MNRQLTDEEVTKVEQDLRGAEALLERVGRDVCSAEGSCPCWMAINEAVSKVQDAIHSAFTMRPERKGEPA